MTKDEMSLLVDKYFSKEGYQFPTGFEHRFERDSSAMMYSIIRKYKPSKCLEIGSWLGGSTAVIMAALIKNGNPFTFVCSELEDDLRKSTAQNVLQHQGREPIMVGDITKNLDKIPESLDFLFVDTNHDLDTTKWIVENIWPKVSKGGIFCMHDWPVYELDGVLKPKDGSWPETQYLLSLMEKNTFPFKKLYFAYENNPGEKETGFWINL